jgi:hypothetical protein
MVSIDSCSIILSEFTGSMKNIDFSSTAIKKAVNAEISQNPVSIYSGFGSVASVLYMLLFGFTSPAFALSLGLLLLSGSSFIFNKYFREEVFEKRYVEKLRAELKANAQEMLDGLKKELNNFNCNEGAKQIDELKEKFESMVSVLNKKLTPGSLVYNRFMGMAEQVYHNGLDNLRQVAAGLDSISPINKNDIESRLKKIEPDSQNNPDLLEELNMLKETLQKRENKMNEVDRLLRQNTIAMAGLDQTAMDISSMESSGEQAKIEMEDAMNELIRLGQEFKDFKTI